MSDRLRFTRVCTSAVRKVLTCGRRAAQNKFITTQLDGDHPVGDLAEAPRAFFDPALIDRGGFLCHWSSGDCFF